MVQCALKTALLYFSTAISGASLSALMSVTHDREGYALAAGEACNMAMQWLHQVRGLI